jgi:transposase
MRTEAFIEVLEERRRIAARMFERGLDSNLIASVVDTHPQTVRRWRRVYEAGGWEALKSKPHLGPRCKLDDAQKQRFLEMLEQPPSAYGLGEGMWTTKRMARLILDTFGVTYSHNHVGVIMHELGYSLQMPAKQARERDETKVREWVEQAWPDIVAQVRRRKSVLLWVDEAGYSMIPTLRRQWAPRGKTPVVKHRNRWYRKVDVIGGIALDQADGLDLVLHWHPGQHIDQQKVVEYLRALVAQFGETIDIVWDNLSSHRGKLVRDLLAEHPSVQLHRLPPYAPDLNPMEGVWSLTKYHRMANHDIADLQTLQQRAEEAIADIADQPHLLRSCINHTGLGDALWPSRDQ